MPFTSYLPNIPAATDQLSFSQGQIQTNFGALQLWLDVNHVDYTNATLGGMHNRVDLPTQGAAPVVLATIAGVITLYSQTSAYTSQPEICVKKQNSGVHYEFTSSNYGSGSATNPGWVIMPAGIMHKWCNGTFDGAGQLTMILNSAGQPTFVAGYIGLATARTGTSAQFIAFTGAAPVVSAQFTGDPATTASFLVIGLATSN